MSTPEQICYSQWLGVDVVLVAPAEAVVESASAKLSFCNVTVRKQTDEIVGHFRGTVYHTQKPHCAEGARS